MKRFWDKVDVRGPDECWDWSASLNGRGYGAFAMGGRMRTASRIAWTLTHGDPGRLHVLHRCDRPRCCNPAHLFLGTPKDNVEDMIAKGRRRHVAPRGSRHGRAKLTEADVVRIRERVAAGETRVAVAAAFGVANQLVSGIVARKYWQHVA